MRNFVEGKVTQHRVWSEGLFSLYVKANIDPFLAGQFTQIGLPKDGKMIFRPYSFSNAPFEEELEFYYIHVPKGALTPHLVELKEGSSIFIHQKAAGRFLIEEVPPAQTLWLIATGTGLGVFLAFLKMENTWRRYQKIVLVHSVRTKEGLTHQELIASFQKRYPLQFQWIPIVTQEKVPETYSRRINYLIENGELESNIGLNLSPLTSQVMLCGNPLMVKETVSLLEKRDFKQHHLHQPGQIHLENYWK
jgi:ferredoxin--NADP+ reductase